MTQARDSSYNYHNKRLFLTCYLWREHLLLLFLSVFTSSDPVPSLYN